MIRTPYSGTPPSRLAAHDREHFNPCPRCGTQPKYYRYGDAVDQPPGGRCGTKVACKWTSETDCPVELFAPVPDGSSFLTIASLWNAMTHDGDPFDNAWEEAPKTGRIPGVVGREGKRITNAKTPGFDGYYDQRMQEINRREAELEAKAEHVRKWEERVDAEVTEIIKQEVNASIEIRWSQKQAIIDREVAREVDRELARRDAARTEIRRSRKRRKLTVCKCGHCLTKEEN